MTRKAKHLVLMTGASAAVIGAFALAAPVMAQETTPAAAPSSEVTVVVTARRKALQSATERKKNSDTVIDSVVADEAGKLPDNSVTEVLQRVPGVVHGVVRLDALQDENGANTQLFHAVGNVYLRRAKIDNGLNLRGAQIEGDLHAGDTLIGNMVNLGTVDEKQLKEFPFTADRVVLSGMRLDGRLYIDGAIVRGLFDANGIDVSADVAAG